VLLTGLALVAAVLIWLGLYLNERTLAQFFGEWAYWSAVCIFLLPAAVLIIHGRDMVLGRGISLMNYIEILIILIVLAVIALIGFG